MSEMCATSGNEPTQEQQRNERNDGTQKANS